MADITKTMSHNVGAKSYIMSFKIPSILPDQDFNCDLESLGILECYNMIIGEVDNTNNEPNNQMYIESFLSKLSPMALMCLGLDRISIDILSNQLTDSRGLIPSELMDYIMDNTYTEAETYQWYYGQRCF